MCILRAVLLSAILLATAAQESNFVCYNDQNCATSVERPVFDVADSFSECCGKPDVVSVRNDSSSECLQCGPSSATRVTPRVVALFPPSNLVLEISATGYTDITWLVNGTAMHAFSRLELEDDSKRFILNNTSTDDIGVYEADVIFNNGTIVMLDFLVSAYASPDVIISSPTESDVTNDRVNITCVAQANPVPSNLTIYCDGLQTTNEPFSTITEGDFGLLSIVMSTQEVDASNTTGLQQCHCRVSTFNGQQIEQTIESIFLLSSPANITQLTPSSSKIVVAPNPVELTCTAQSRPIPNLQWSRNQDVLSTRDNIEISMIDMEPNVRTSSLVINDTSYEDDGVYMCTAMNTYGNASATVTVSIHLPPNVTTPEKNKIVNINAQQSVTLICRATGNPQPQVLWINKRGPLNNNCSGGMLNEAFGEAALDHNAFDTNNLFPSEAAPTAPIGEAPEVIGPRGNCSIQVFIDNSSLPVTTSELTILDLHMLESETFICVSENGVDNLLNTSESASIKLELDGSPFIQRRPAKVSNLLEGQDAVFVCTAVDQTNMTITWMRNQQIIHASTPRVTITSEAVSLNHFSGMALNSTLVVMNVSQDDSGNYTCFIADNEGDHSQHTISQIVYTRPSASIDQDSPVVAVEGEQAVFSCSATGIPLPVITWKFFNKTAESFQTLENNTFSDLNIVEMMLSEPNTLTSEVTLTSVMSSGVNRFVCNVTNPFGLSTAAIDLVVHVPVTITSPPQDQTVAESQSVVFSCKATGVPPPTIMWYKAETIITNGVTNSTFGSTVQSNLTISSSDLSDDGIYMCIAVNKIGSPSQSVSVNDTVQLTIFPGKPVIVTPITPTEALAGDNITLTCIANGFPSPSIVWLKEGSEVVTDDRVTITNTTNATLVGSSHLAAASSMITITGAQLEDAGNYSCQVVNENGISTQEISTVSVFIQPVIVIPPSTPIATTPGNNLTLQCNASGYPAATITWLKEGSPTDAGDIAVTISNSSDGVVFVSSILTLTNVGAEDSGSYSCRAVNNASNVTRVVAEITITAPATVSIQPETSVYTIGSVTIINCRADGLPTPNITFAGVQCPSLAYVQVTEGVVVSCSGPNEATLTINSVSSIDPLMFLCTASNGDQPAVMATASVSVNVPPAINILSTVTELNEGDTLTLVCEAMARSTSNITWLFQDALLLQDNTDTITVTNAQINFYSLRSTLERSSLIPADSGEYKCRLEDSSANGNIVITDAVSIDVEPFDDCAPIQPCVNGDCTDLLRDYVCNCNGNYTGKNCSVPPDDMTQPPNITEPPEDIFAELFKPINLTCNAKGNPIYHWERDNIHVATISDTVFQIAEVRPEDRGRYRCSAENSAGIAVSASALVTIQGLYQYLVTITSNNITVNSTDFIEDVSDCLVTTTIGSTEVIIYSVQQCNQTNTCVSTQTMVQVIVTVVKLQPPFAVPNLAGELRNTLNIIESKFGVNVLSVVRFDGCPVDVHVLSDEHDSRITWPEATIGDKLTRSCPCGVLQDSVYFNNTATRVCNGTYTFGGAWESPDTSLCDYNQRNLNITLGLCQITTVTDPVRQAEELSIATREADSFHRLDFTISSLIMNQVATSMEIRANREMQNNYLSSLDNLTRTDPTVIADSQATSGSARRVLNSLRDFERFIDLPNNTMDSRVLGRTGISIIELGRTDFRNQSFSIVSGETLVNLTTSEGDDPSSQQESFNASIFLPESILDGVNITMRTNNSDNVRISYTIFLSDSLFQVDPNSNLGMNLRQTNLSVNNMIISATITNTGKVENLDNPVIISFRKPPKLSDNETNSASCVFWDEATSDGFGNWSDHGCRLVSDQMDDFVVCECDHLTHFGYLLAVSPAPPSAPVFALEIINYVCTCISIVCLLITIATYLATKKLHEKTLGKLLINMCIALIGLYVFALMGGGPLILANRIVCAVVGALLHYFMLVYFFWTAVESIDVYRKLVIVLGSKINHYPIYGGLVAWGVPVIIVAVAAGAGYQSYFDALFFCRPVGLPFYIGFLLPFVVIYVFNWLLFILIIVSLCKRDLLKKKMKDQALGKQAALNRAESKKYFIITITLSVNFGLGWIVGLLATSELGIAHLVFVYLFSIFVALQGVLIFVLHCLRVPAARTTWKYWFYRICCCKSQYAAKQSTRSTAPTPFSTPYNRRKVPLGASVESSKPSKFQKYLEESEASEVIANPLQGISEADTDITRETFIPDLSPYNDFDNDLPDDYTYAVVDKSKKRKKKSSTAKEEARSGSKKTSKQEQQKNRSDSLYYSVGEMSMESQALEVEFEPESGSEDEAEEWKRLQETLKDIHLAVDSDRNDYEMDVVY